MPYSDEGLISDKAFIANLLDGFNLTIPELKLWEAEYHEAELKRSISGPNVTTSGYVTHGPLSRPANDSLHSVFEQSKASEFVSSGSIYVTPPRKSQGKDIPGSHLFDRGKRRRDTYDNYNMILILRRQMNDTDTLEHYNRLKDMLDNYLVVLADPAPKPKKDKYHKTMVCKQQRHKNIMKKVRKRDRYNKQPKQPKLPKDCAGPTADPNRPSVTSTAPGLPDSAVGDTNDPLVNHWMGQMKSLDKSSIYMTIDYMTETNKSKYEMFIVE